MIIGIISKLVNLELIYDFYNWGVIYYNRYDLNIILVNININEY